MSRPDYALLEVIIHGSVGVDPYFVDSPWPQTHRQESAGRCYPLENYIKAGEGWVEAASGTPVSERFSFHRRTALMASRPSRDLSAAPALV